MAEKKEDIETIAAYISGVASIILAFITPAGIGGIVAGIVGLSINKKGDGLSKRAKKLNIIGIIFGIIVLIIYAWMMYKQLQQTGLYPTA